METKAACYIVLETLTEVGKGCPESSIYIALGSNLDFSNDVIGILTQAGFITNKRHWIELTPKGKEIGEKVVAAKAAMAARKKAEAPTR